MIKNIIIFTLTISLSTGLISQNKNESGLRVLTSFHGDPNTKAKEKPGNSSEKILFSIRKYIAINQDIFKDDFSKYGLDNLSLLDTRTILKYKYLEKAIKFSRELEDLLSPEGSSYNDKNSWLVKGYENVSSEEIVYRSIIQFSSLEKTNNSYEFILDNKFKVLRASRLHLFK